MSGLFVSSLFSQLTVSGQQTLTQMSNASGIFPCNIKPQTKRRQKGRAVKRMGSSFSCAFSPFSALSHFPLQATPCRLPSVPDFVSSSHSSQKQRLDLWKSKSTLSQGLVDNNIAALPTASFKTGSSDLGSPKANVLLQGGSVGADLLREKYSWSFLRC